MANTLTLSEPTVDYLMAAWTGLRLERGVSSTNLGSFTLVAQIPYVTGQTTYTYVDSTGAASDWYRVARYGPSGIGTYSPPWPVAPQITTTGDGARRSYKNCRRMLARKLSSLQVITTTADGNDAGTTLISRALANQVDANRHRSWWAMPSDGVSRGEVRSIGENALNPSSGQLAIVPAYLSMIVQGTQVELHQKLPPDESVGPPIGLRQCLNMALAECWVLDRLAVTGTGAVTMDLASLGDWIDPAAIYELYGPTLAGVAAYPYGQFSARADAAVVALDVVGLSAGASVDVALTRPGDTYIKVNGVWTDNQQGFANDDDECLFQPTFITQIALAHAYDALANTATGAPQARYQKLAEEQHRTANMLKLQLPRPAERASHAASGYGYDWTSKDSFG